MTTIVTVLVVVGWSGIAGYGITHACIEFAERYGKDELFMWLSVIAVLLALSGGTWWLAGQMESASCGA